MKKAIQDVLVVYVGVGSNTGELVDSGKMTQEEKKIKIDELPLGMVLLRESGV